MRRTGAARRACANARFSQRRNGLWMLVAQREIKRGEEVTVPYAQHDTDGVPLCCACGVALTGKSVELDSEFESESESE